MKRSMRSLFPLILAAAVAGLSGCSASAVDGSATQEATAAGGRAGTEAGAQGDRVGENPEEKTVIEYWHCNAETQGGIDGG